MNVTYIDLLKFFFNLKRFLGYVKISIATQKYWHDLLFTVDIFGKKWENPQFGILSLVHEKCLVTSFQYLKLF